MEIEEISSGHAKRLSTADSLLPTPPSWETPAGDGATPTTLTTPEGAARATVTHLEPWSSSALSQPLVEYRLDVRLAGESPGSALAELLDEWERRLLADVPRGDWETAAVVPRPSRDTVGTDALYRRGFAAARVLAVRPADRLGSGPPAVPGVRIRQAERGDLDTVVRLWTELRRFDAQFGSATVRDDERRLLTAEAEGLLSDAVPALWMAELYGSPLGFVHAQLPPASNWIADHIAADRIGYLAALHVAEEARSTGVGTALAAHAHQLFDEAGVEAVLVHHALANPRSTPFWYAQGYRPLWTYWTRRPARRVR